jgi:hypothetical protein
LNLLLAAMLVPALFWDRGPDTAQLLLQAKIKHIAVPAADVGKWKSVSGITVEAADPQGMQKLQAPGVKFRRHGGGATQAPWVDSNGWRLIRNPDAKYFYEAPGPNAALAASEAFAYGVHAVIHTDTAGLKSFGDALDFLCRLDVPDYQPLVNVGFIDDGSPESGEFMNLLVRRNLLFRPVKTADSSLDLTVKLGSPEYPRTEAGNPSLLAEKVRGNLTDEKRLLRIYGSDLVIGRLVGNKKQATLFLLNYGTNQRPVDGLRVKILGGYQIKALADYGAPNESPADVVHSAQSTEFTLKDLGTFAMMSLSR